MRRLFLAGCLKPEGGKNMVNANIFTMMTKPDDTLLQHEQDLAHDPNLSS